MEEGNNHMLTALLLGLRDEIYQRFEEMSRKWSQLQNIDTGCQVKAAVEQLSADLNRFESTDMKKIEAIEKALLRVNSGRYGICETCGAFISEQHLLAVPWTAECVHCAPTKPLRNSSAAIEIVRDA